MNYDLANSKFFYHLDSNPSSSVDYKNKFRSKNKVTFKGITVVNFRLFLI